jgi:urease accessory protein
MPKLTQLAPEGAEPTRTLTLSYEARCKSRLLVKCDEDGEMIGLILERGRVLRDGDCLTGEGGMVARVRAAQEPVSIARVDDPLRFARACYHLGNRHTPLQILSGELRYLHDPVLDAMLRKLGLAVALESAPFDPEPGAYAHSAAGHGHGA